MSLIDGFFYIIRKYLTIGIIPTWTSPQSSVNLKKFIETMFEVMQRSEEFFVVMAIYFDRLLSRQSLVVNESNMLRLIFMAGFIAVKMYDDFFPKNSNYCKFFGLQNYDLNHLEKNFLQWIDYKLMISDQEYQHFYNILKSKN